jgi:hypothetical protein
MRYVYDDGGREAAGYKGTTGDCVCRAVAIASGEDYKGVYRELAMGAGTQRRSKVEKRKGKRSVASAAQGISVKRKWFQDYMRGLGFEWVPTMTIGSGCQVHLRDGELPMGRLVVSVSKHYVAVINGVIHDIYDPQRGEERCVYGYWQLKPGRYFRRSKAGDPGPELLSRMLGRLLG